jgi:hypothetical protein
MTPFLNMFPFKYWYLVNLLLGPSLFTAAASAAAVCSLQCANLAALLPNKVSYPGSSAFVSSITSYFFIGSRLNPTCVVTPTSTDDVAAIVKTLGRLHQKTPVAQFAIRGGGHSPNFGASDINQGVTIDMRSIKNIQVSNNGSMTSVGGGAIWSDVYAALLPMNLSVVGGRVAGPGLGGLTTGGTWLY